MPHSAARTSTQSASSQAQLAAGHMLSTAATRLDSRQRPQMLPT